MEGNVKKLIFMLLIAFALVWLLPAQETGDGGEKPQDSFCLTALSGEGAEFRAVTPDSVSIPLLAEYGDFAGVSFIAERHAVAEKIFEKFHRCGILDGIIYERADIKTGLYKEAPTLRGA
jgi:hypothetical protein